MAVLPLNEEAVGSLFAQGGWHKSRRRRCDHHAVPSRRRFFYLVIIRLHGRNRYFPQFSRDGKTGAVKSRILGQTELVVSRMGLGLAALGRPGYINLGHRADLGRDIEPASMEAVAYAVLDAAWKAGVRYFDAARSYGMAESFLANWLASRQVAAGALTVGSKWGYTYTAGWKVDAKVHEEKDLSLKTLARQAAESRQILGARPQSIPDTFGHAGERRAGKSRRAQRAGKTSRCRAAPSA